MANKYYVYVMGIRTLEGSFSFREAMARKIQYDSFGVFTQILKVVVDENGEGGEIMIGKKNKYYAHVMDTRKLEGLFSFREAMARKIQYDSFGVSIQILRVVVDEDGKEVK